MRSALRYSDARRVLWLETAERRHCLDSFGEKVSFIWSVADLIRDAFKRSKYQDVILPFTVLRRIDCVLEPTKDKVLDVYSRLKGKLQNLAPQLCRASGFAFYNTSPFTFERLLADAPNLARNLRAYINGFSENMREVLEKFDFPNTIAKLDEAGLLFLVMERFKGVDLHPDKVSNLEMGYIFEELIRRFNEALNENPGEHFTPREVIRLMVDLLLSRDREALSRNHIVRTIYDPCCGSGGMLTIAKERILEINPNAEVYIFGQEVNPETWAVSKSDMLMVSPDGHDAENIAFGSTLSNDRHADKRFDYLLTNPPYGKDWKRDEAEVRRDAERGYAGRFGAGLPRISDGQLLFLQHMLGRMKDPREGGSRVAIVMNASPLFTGDAGSGESEIRRWILENDWLEAIIALPEQLFYNTGIATYVWVLTNRKEKRRKGKVQLIDASSFWAPMRRSLGDKRREITTEHIRQITDLYERFAEGAHSKIFDTAYFGYRKITVERPLRLNFQASPERIERLKGQKAFLDLAASRKRAGKARAAEEAAGRRQQDAILAMLAALPPRLYKSRPAFEGALNDAAKATGLKLSAGIRKAIFAALSERDENAEVCLDADGHPEPDPELRDTENVPLGEDIHAYFDREVAPHVPDAWVNTGIRDHKDGEVGKVGYEINFSRYFYRYAPPRALPEIEADIRKLEAEIVEMLRSVTFQSTGHGGRAEIDPATPSPSQYPKWRKYAEYSRREVACFGEIPAHWEVLPLKRAFTVQLGKMLQSSANSSRDTLEPYLRAANIFWEGVDLNDVKTMWLSEKDKELYSLRSGDLLVSEGGDAGRAAMWRGELDPCYIQNSINRVRSKGVHSTRFLYYWLYALKHSGYIDAVCSRATIAHFTAEKLERVPVLLPPPNEQELICAFLDREIAKLDGYVGRTLAGIDVLREYRTALISAAVTGKIDVREYVA